MPWFNWLSVSCLIDRTSPKLGFPLLPCMISFLSHHFLPFTLFLKHNNKITTILKLPLSKQPNNSYSTHIQKQHIKTKLREKLTWEQICSCSLLLSFSLSTPHSYPLPILVFSFVCRCSPTRWTILTSSLSIRPSTSVLCHSFHPWPLLLFAGCAFALNSGFLLHRSALMDNLWDEG
jgi:hypothetical protein